MSIDRSWLPIGVLATAVLSAAVPAVPLGQAASSSTRVPRVWYEAALAEWATPLAGLNVRPTHISTAGYYSLSVENLRTYPVYFPGREPEGYWEMLQRVGPKPLIEPAAITTDAAWVDAGRRVFDELDDLQLRTFDPKFVTAARSPDTYRGRAPLPDGTVSDLRWVPTKDGVALSVPNCRNCHLQYLPDGTRVPGAPTFARQTPGAGGRSGLNRAMQTANRYVTGGAPFQMAAGEPLGNWLYQASGVPWRPDDVNARVKAVSDAEYNALISAVVGGGGVPRWNGSLYHPAKIPDLIGIRDRKYIDHTATHLHRNAGDFMRYAALVSFAETSDFGSYHMLAAGTRRPQRRVPDDALYALAMYVYSLQPPPNPNSMDERARAGQKIFAREGCVQCHTPPLYTSNKVTLAQGFAAPGSPPAGLDVLPITVGTDPGLALDTRKGTGFYKVPSLRGVWYRGHYLHDGAAASLEEMFDPDRVKDTHVAGGWKLPSETSHPIKGHPFGLLLDPSERAQLLAFLRTL
ncbi:MAG TPA: di-heme oxidoredictase family protein [Vicinamibacterales bacterium]|jgi:hypothetical protein|nr:di-heme oxidoredictase family protein [Vicinamibacterales bacterium]